MMKQPLKHPVSPLEKAYGVGLLVILGLIVFHAPLSVWLGTFTDADLLIKSWKELLMAALVIPAAYLVWSRPEIKQRVTRKFLLRLIVGYALLHLVLTILFWNGIAPVFAGLAIDLRYLLFFVLVYIAVLTVPEFRRRAILVTLIAAAASLIFAVLQIIVLPKDALEVIGYSRETIAPYLTIDKNPDFVRINGTMRGPNPLGAYVVIMASLAAAYLLINPAFKHGAKNAKLLAVGILTASPLVLWASYSRSAWLAAIAAAALLAVMVFGKRINRYVLAGAFIAPAIALGVGLYVFRDSSFVSHVIVHKDPEDPVGDDSNVGHATSLTEGLERALNEPLGKGPGSTGSASLLGDAPLIVENQYLFIAHEVGWLGLGLFLSIFGFLPYRLWWLRDDWLATGVFVSGIGLFLIGILQPVWADDTVAIVWWGLAALACAPPRPAHWRSQ